MSASHFVGLGDRKAKTPFRLKSEDWRDEEAALAVGEAAGSNRFSSDWKDLLTHACVFKDFN